jgi:hypothetical protein
MTSRKFLSRALGVGTRLATVATLAFACVPGVAAGAGAAGPERSLQGTIEGDGVAQPGYDVSLYASYSGGVTFVKRLGTDTTDDGGKFTITYRLPPGPRGPLEPVLYVLAEKDEAMLASAIDNHNHIVVDELTTVAIGTAFAQFIDGRAITGNTYGMRNAVEMAGNMANPRTGAIGEVLDNSPNGSDTSTRMTFYSMANIVASCVEFSASCDRLFEYATPKGGPRPTTVLQAVANVTKYPSKITIANATGLFDLSLVSRAYGPALGEEPASWLLFIKFTGGFYSAYNAGNLMSGPGQIGFDPHGFAWINDNYVPSDFDPAGVDPDDLPIHPALDQIGCAGLRLLKFFPSGAPVPGTPYFGGGLSGAGFGIALDPAGKIWVGNFGFESPLCADGTVPADPSKKVPATHNSVSLFLPNGTPISGPDGFTKGQMWWPQGMASDKRGNIWIGNCGNDTVTLIPRGKPGRARNIAIPGGQGAMGNYQPVVDDEFDPDRPLIKPFGVALDPKGRAWVVGNAVGFNERTSKTTHTGGLYRISKEGSVVMVAGPGDQLLSFPMGVAGDSRGNMWVANSDHVSVPCVTPFSTQQGGAIGPSLAYFPADSSDSSVAHVFGLPTQSDPDVNTGGLTIPWGDFVDGNDTVWVFNFGATPTDDEGGTALSHFCGADTEKCPAGLRLGDAISPPSGYVSDALDRVTGGGVDRSGNIWILNNWKKLGPVKVGPDYPVFDRNPGGNSFVIVPGAAAPIKTPLLGPPESFDAGKHRSAASRGSRS